MRLWRTFSGTRFGNSETFSMDLSVAVRMNEDAVLCAVCATQRFIHDVVVMPSRYLGDGLVTDWADASLFFPQVQQFAFPV